jgi:membrane-associated phospholipid phosphatase
MPLNTILKDFLERPRPDVVRPEINVPVKTDFAYPSGHASMVSSGALILIILYRKEKELIFSSLLAVEAALVCLSRIYVGDHYFFDVVGGALLGSGISLLSVYFSKYLDPLIKGVRKYIQKSP